MDRLLAPVLADVQRVAGWLWQRDWAEAGAGNISIDVTELLADKDDIPALGGRVGHDTPDSAVPDPGAITDIGVPVLAGRRLLVSAAGARFRDIASDRVVGLLLVRVTPDGHVFVEWDPNTEADLAGYKLYYGTTSRIQGSYAETVVINDKDSTGWSLTLPGDTYYFALTAYDMSGNESGFSDEVSAVVPDSGAPGKPGRPIFIP